MKCFTKVVEAGLYIKSSPLALSSLPLPKLSEIA